MTQRVAGALGFEPRLSVLETDVLPLTPCPSRTAGRPSQLCPGSPDLLYFLMGIVLPAELTELIPLQPIQIVFLVLHGR